MTNAKNTNTRMWSRKAIFGAAIAYAAFWIALFLPLPASFAIPVAGAIAILLVEYISSKFGLFIL
mgnify:CR=1 FL=1